MAPTRRTVLKRGVAGLTGGLLTGPAVLHGATRVFQPPTSTFPRRTLWLHRLQTQEEGRVLYYQDHAVAPDGYALLCYLLRDVPAEQVAPMDLKLMHLLFGLQTWMRACGIRQPLRIHSGYRTEPTPADPEGAALHSRHHSGQAVDLTVEGMPHEVLATLARRFHAGGVAVSATFVHVDTGAVRGGTG